MFDFSIDPFGIPEKDTGRWVPVILAGNSGQDIDRPGRIHLRHKGPPWAARGEEEHSWLNGNAREQYAQVTLENDLQPGGSHSVDAQPIRTR